MSRWIRSYRGDNSNKIRWNSVLYQTQQKCEQRTWLRPSENENVACEIHLLSSATILRDSDTHLALHRSRHQSTNPSSSFVSCCLLPITSCSFKSGSLATPIYAEIATRLHTIPSSQTTLSCCPAAREAFKFAH